MSQRLRKNFKTRGFSAGPCRKTKTNNQQLPRKLKLKWISGWNPNKCLGPDSETKNPKMRSWIAGSEVYFDRPNLGIPVFFKTWIIKFTYWSKIEVQRPRNQMNHTMNWSSVAYDSCATKMQLDVRMLTWQEKYNFKVVLSYLWYIFQNSNSLSAHWQNFW